MTRRCLLLSAIAFNLRADPAREVWDVLSAAASALGEGNAARFLEAFDTAMPGLGALRADATALAAAWDVESSIDLIEGGGDSGKQSLELDWLLHITQRGGTARATRRRQRVKCRFEKQGKGWRIVWFEPMGFFAVPRM